MTNGNDVRDPLETSRPYFFLSYAHSDPLAGNPGSDPDELVREFFNDLSDAVRSQAGRRAEFVSGFFDQKIPVGADWNESLTQALCSAEVFVPLYSPGYVSRSWPGRELACFHRRMELAGVQNPKRRFLPVLWTPLTGTQDPPGLREALALSTGQPDYPENGLRALKMIRLYRRSYQAVVNALAKQIVVLAEGSPVEPSSACDINIDTVPSWFTSEPTAIFTIETAVRNTAWRPFAQQELPLTDYARQVAERFDFKAQITGIQDVCDKDHSKPGIILIDPWFIAEETGKIALRSAIRRLPRWVLPVLILDQSGDDRSRELARQIRGMLAEAKVLPTAPSRRAAQGVGSLDDFLGLVRVLVAGAERQYLRHRNQRALSPQPSDRLTGPGLATPHGQTDLLRHQIR